MSALRFASPTPPRPLPLLRQAAGGLADGAHSCRDARSFGQSVRVPDVDDSGERRQRTERESELANECIAAAESALATLMPDLADRLGSSREAAGVYLAIIDRMVANEIPSDTSQIAAGLVAQARELRWPNWRDGIPAPPPQTCSSCATEWKFAVKQGFRHCPACGNALD